MHFLFFPNSENKFLTNKFKSFILFYLLKFYLFYNFIKFYIFNIEIRIKYIQQKIIVISNFDLLIVRIILI